jgi:hypothetical protein
MRRDFHLMLPKLYILYILIIAARRYMTIDQTETVNSVTFYKDDILPFVRRALYTHWYEDLHLELLVLHSFFRHRSFFQRLRDLYRWRIYF